MSPKDKTGILEQIAEKQETSEYAENYRKLHWEGTFSDYLGLVKENPKITRNAFQRMYDLIIGEGSEPYEECKKKIIHYKFFDDTDGGGQDAIYGLDIHLMKFVNVLKSAALGHATANRLFLLHGPVGSSKSTIVRLLKKGIERYSWTDEGALYTFKWDAEIDGRHEHMDCPMHEEPLKLIPRELRKEVFEKLCPENLQIPTKEGELSSENFQIPIKEDDSLCPICRFMYNKLNEQCNGRFSEIMEHITVKRFLLSEEDRRGIGTFQPKDEKNQDSTELSGDVNYRRLAEIGSDSDPRAFSFDGEFQVANRGIIEFVEMLKLDTAFLYDLLGASQEHRIKPKRFAQVPIDELIIGHTNEPEFRKLQADEFMEALKDRTVRIDVPYNTNWKREVKIYEKDYTKRKVKRHIAPHTLEMAAMWAVLTRLEEPEKSDLSIVQKLKLYSGKIVQGYTEDHIKELRKNAKREGLDGISPRFVQDALTSSLVSDQSVGCLNPFLLFKEIGKQLRTHSLIKNEGDRSKYTEMIDTVKQEYEEIVKNEVQRAISADAAAISKLCGNYIDNLKAYTQKEKIKNRYTDQYEEPDERLMRQIEEKINIAEGRKDEFRRQIMSYIGACAVEGKRFDYTANESLQKALELKLFEDQKDTIKLSTLVSNVVDKETQEKIDIIKKRMIDNYKYCDVCATDVLNFVSSVFARGNPKDE